MERSNVKVPMLNRAQISGRIANDIEIKYTASKATAVLRITVANDKNYKDASGAWQKETVFIPCVLWGAIAENTAKNAKKGMPVIVEGRINIEKYTMQDGTERSQTNIVAERVDILEWMPKPEEGMPPPPSANPDVPF